MIISHSYAVDESELPDDDVLSLSSSTQAVSMLLASGNDEQDEAEEINDGFSDGTLSPCAPHMMSF